MGFERTFFTKVAATALVLVLAAASAAAAVPTAGMVSGTVFLGADRSPLERATVHLSNTADDRLTSSNLTDSRGSFKFESLAAATYEVAVEYDGGLYLVGSPIQVRTGQPLVLNLAIEKSAVAPTAVPQARRGAGGLFASPLAATLMVAGTAVAIGAVIESTNSSDTDPVASQFLTR